MGFDHFNGPRIVVVAGSSPHSHGDLARPANRRPPRLGACCRFGARVAGHRMQSTPSASSRAPRPRLHRVRRIRSTVGSRRHSGEAGRGGHQRPLRCHRDVQAGGSDAGAGVARVSWDSHRDGRRARRTPIWCGRQNGWQQVFLMRCTPQRTNSLDRGRQRVRSGVETARLLSQCSPTYAIGRPWCSRVSSH